MHPIENIMKCSVEQIKNMVDVNTIVGTPLMTAGETMVVPVSKVSLGFMSGGGEYMAKTPIKKSGGELYRKLKDKVALVRHSDAPRISNWLRITIGTPDDMTALLRALDEILEG